MLAAALIASSTARAATYPAGFEERTLVSGLTEPTNVAWAPDGRMFVIEKRGTLKVVPPGGTTATTILDISARVNSHHDRGLLGLALDSNFASNGYVYLLYTYELRPLVSDSDSRMVSRLGRFTVSPTNVVSAETVLLGTYASGTCPSPSNTVDCIPSDGLSHSIGTVISAPDGTLWVGSGDAASYSTVDTRAFRTYDERSLAGKILHVDRNGRGLPGHSFCPTNANLAHNCTKLHAKGFRNPFRFTLRPSGGLAVGDVGWSQWEEVDLVRTAGKSYGWPCYEGASRTSGYRDRSECATEYAKEGTANAHAAPDHTYPHVGSSAVMAGPTVTGGGYPASYSGDVFFGDYAAGFVKRIELDGSGNVSAVRDFATDLYSVSLQATPGGELAYVSFGDGSPGSGSIRRVVYAADNRSPTALARATPESGAAPLEVEFDGSGSSDLDGDPLTYEWDFGDGTPTAAGARPSHTYPAAGNYTARLTVRDGKGGSDSATVQIVVGGSPPQAAIASPADNSTYRDGEVVAISGTGTDPQDGTLPASAFHWVVRLYHADHLHPVTTVSGTKTPSFTTLADHDADSHYEVTLTVTDSTGLTDSETIRLNPESVTVTLASQPTGAPVTYAGVSGSAPLVRTSAVGFRTTISAAERFTSGGREWVFDRWSDGGARQHDVTIPAANATLTAHYRDGGGSSLVAAYGFEEGSGASVADASGRGNAGTVSGASWSNAGKFGRALDFDGADDWVTVPDSSSLDLTSAMTIEAWVKTDNPDKQWQTVAMKEARASGGLAYALYATGSSPYFNAWWNFDSLWAPEPHRLAAGTWTHLAAASDGATMRIYLNGALLRSRTVSGALPASPDPLRLGGNSVWPGDAFDGLIDEVRIYNRALSAAEIVTDRDRPIGGSGPPPDTSPPTVSVTLPASGATVQGSVDVAASATDDVGVQSVQFRLDGQELGSADTTAPFEVPWNTLTTANGQHSITAVARDAAGNSSTSAAIPVTVSNPQASSGLVAAYGFEEGSGTTTRDASGSGNTGVLSGAGWTSAGRHNRGLLLDGVDDWVTVADSASLDLTGAMTLEAWVKPDTTARTWQTVVLKEAPGELAYGLYATGGSPHVNGWWRDAGLYAPGTQPLAAGAWTHLAVTATSSTLRLYLGGEQVATRTVNGGPAATALPLRIGGNAVWANEFFGGVIDDVRIYDRALSAGEVQSDMAIGVPAG